MGDEQSQGRQLAHNTCPFWGSFWVLGYACNMSNLGCSYTGKVAVREITKHKK